MILAAVAFHVFWITGTEMIHHTSKATFCSSCHVMQPMTDAFYLDAHGGRGRTGVRLECTDCHLPQGNAFKHLVHKTKSGLHDIWANFTYDLEAIDWEKNRERREEYTLNASCINCHSELEQGAKANPKAFVAHKPYFLGETTKTCIACHKNVGHKDLGFHLSKNKGTQ